MGNVTVSTAETEIYYPSSWLVNGGPPISSGCPKYVVDEDCDGQSVLSLVYDWDLKKWYILFNLHGSETECREGRVLMESTNIHDVTNYLMSYMAESQDWRARNSQ